MCDWVHLYARRHEDTWIYAIVCGVTLQIEGVLLVGIFLDEDVRYVIGVDIPRLGERISHEMG